MTSAPEISWQSVRQLLVILIGILGTFGGVFGAWVNMSNQQEGTEVAVAKVEQRLDRIESRLDRLIEQGNDSGR